MLNLVDLAGSERLKKSESQGIRLKEALHINSSLTALGKVVIALDSAGHGGGTVAGGNPDTAGAGGGATAQHVPFRDSKLTRVLQNSLGGNSFTSVVAALHPNPAHYEECLSTLQFANRCRNVTNNPRVNYLGDAAEDKDRKLKRLSDELTLMRSKLTQCERQGGLSSLDYVTKLSQLLNKLGVKASVTSRGGLMLNGVEISAEILLAEDGDTSGAATAGGSDATAGAGVGKGIGGSKWLGTSVEDYVKQSMERTKLNASEMGEEIAQLVTKYTTFTVHECFN
jgi:hypothetical protein